MKKQKRKSYKVVKREEYKKLKALLSVAKISEVSGVTGRSRNVVQLVHDTEDFEAYELANKERMGRYRKVKIDIHPKERAPQLATGQLEYHMMRVEKILVEILRVLRGKRKYTRKEQSQTKIPGIPVNQENKETAILGEPSETQFQPPDMNM